MPRSAHGISSCVSPLQLAGNPREAASICATRKKGLPGLRNTPGRRQGLRAAKSDRRDSLVYPGDHRSFVGTFFWIVERIASTEGSIDVDQVEGDVALCDRQLFLLLHLRGFQIKDSIEVHNAKAVLLDAELRGRHGRLCALGKIVGLFLGPLKAPQSL